MALVNGGFLHYMDMRKFLKNLLLRNFSSDFEIILQECYLGDPFQKLFLKFWSVYKHGSGEWGLFALYGQIEILKKSFSPKLLIRFWNNFTEMFLVWFFFKNCSHNFDLSINMALVNGGFLYYTDMKKFIKNLLRNRWSDFEIISQECSLGAPFQILFEKFWSIHKHGSCKFFSEREKKNGQGNLKNSGDQTRAMLALLFKTTVIFDFVYTLSSVK